LVNILDLIVKKRDGEDLSRAEIEGFIDLVVRGEIPDYQLGAFLMAVYLCGLNDEETLYLTEAIARSGRMIDLTNPDFPVVDKHSTGGVGDKVSLIVAPLVSACGVGVGLTAGRGLGHTGGTIDKLEAIEGFKTCLSEDEMRDALQKVGCFIASQSDDVAPADRVLYSMRDVTATVESIPLIISSILGKKLAVKTDGIIFDVKYGRGAFMGDRARAEELGDGLKRVVEMFDGRCMVTYTEHNSPHGRAVGNAIEVVETIGFLRNEKVDEGLREVCYRVGALMLVIGGVVDDIEGGKEMIERSHRTGEGLNRFARMVEFQGGDVRVVDDVGIINLADRYSVVSEQCGVIEMIDARVVGELVRDIGGGRKKIGDEVDASVGIELMMSVGDRVERGDVIANIYCRDFSSNLRERFLSAVKLS